MGAAAFGHICSFHARHACRNTRHWRFLRSVATRLSFPHVVVVVLLLHMLHHGAAIYHP